MHYPLTLRFQPFTGQRIINISDATRPPILRARQKAFLLKEIIDIYEETPSVSGKKRYQVVANRVLDFQASYNILDQNGQKIGSIERRGMKIRIKAILESALALIKHGLNLDHIVPIWDVSYHIFNLEGEEIGQIIEKNPKTKFIGTLMAEVFLAKPFLNPIYAVEANGDSILYAYKKPAFFTRTFILEQQRDFTNPNEELLLAGLITTLLMERKLGI